MAQFVPTLTIAFVLVLLALAGLGIGYIITRKKCLRHGCGKNPNDPKKGCWCGSQGECEKDDTKN